tara:strand:+ start:93 stop:1040 length:948 start_codon:yes stop_codon:yes gene_type:complete
LQRYQTIREIFHDDINFIEDKIIYDNKQIRTIHNVPNFIINDLDELTGKMSDFYNEVQFPNYEDCEDYASLYDKGISNLFTKKLDQEVGFGTKILELGCGTGQLSLFLSRCNRKVCAVDISNGSLKLGEDFRKKNNINNTYFMKMDIFDLKFKPNTFDFVISNGVLHHTKNAQQAFKCLVDVTKPGGIIVIGLYHKYGRLITRFKANIAKLIGEKVLYLDKTSRKIKSKDKRKSWIKDQFMNPHETLHTPNEIIKWLEENEIEFLNLLPHFNIQQERLFKKHHKPKITFMEDLLMAVDLNQIREGGFFIVIGRKK